MSQIVANDIKSRAEFLSLARRFVAAVQLDEAHETSIQIAATREEFDVLFDLREKNGIVLRSLVERLQATAAIEVQSLPNECHEAVLLFVNTAKHPGTRHNTIQLLPDLETALGIVHCQIPEEPFQQSSIPQAAFRAVLDGAGAGVVAAALKLSAVDRANITMQKMIESDPVNYVAWVLDDWQAHLQQARKTIGRTEAWKVTIPKLKESMKAARVVSKKTIQNPDLQ